MKVLGADSEDAKGWLAWAGQGCCQCQEPSKGAAGASEAKLQAKAQITAAVGSNFCGPCAQARDCRRL